MSDVVFLLWSLKHDAWWRTGDWGYTNDLEDANRYTETEAVERVVRSAMSGDRRKVTLMVAAPENWKTTDRPAAPRVAARGEADDVGTSPAAGVPPCSGGAPAQDPDSPPYASPMAYRAMPVHEVWHGRRWAW